MAFDWVDRQGRPCSQWTKSQTNRDFEVRTQENDMHRVAYVGWDGSIPADCPGVAERFDPADVLRKSLVGIAAIVFSTRALEEADPELVMHALAGRRAAAVLCIDMCDATRLTSWTLAGFTQVVSRSELAAWLERKLCGPRRPRLEPSMWLERAPCPGTEAWQVAHAVNDIRIAFVGNWSRKVPGSKRRFVELCKSELGGTPDELLQRYLLVATRAMERQDATREDQAQALGYASAATICRALTRARRDWPDVATGT